MSTEAPQKFHTSEKQAKMSLQKDVESLRPAEAPAGGEEQQQQQGQQYQQEQQQQGQQPQEKPQGRRSWAEVVRSEPSRQQQEEQMQQPEQQGEQQQESTYPVGKAGEAQQGPEQPREKEIANFQQTPVERQIQEQKSAGISTSRSEDEKADLVGVVQDEETERNRLLEEDRRAEQELQEHRQQSLEMSQNMQDQEQHRRLSEQDENRQRFVLARKISASLAKEGKIEGHQAEKLKNVGESSEISDKTSRIVLEVGQQEQQGAQSFIQNFTLIRTHTNIYF
jgi:hypothetical protein